MSFHSSLTGSSLHDSKIATGAGAPGSTPSYVGQSYFDTTNQVFYVAVGTSAPSDWKQHSVQAGLNANVIADGSVSSTEFQYINSLTSNAQTQLTANATAISDHLADTADAHDASAISNVPSGNLAATDVQSALNELQSDIDGRQPADSDLTALAGLSSVGVIARTGAGTAAVRTLTSGSSKLSLTNGDGVSGNPTFDVSESNLTLDNIGGTLSVSKGGTGLTAVGSALQVLRTNAGATALEWASTGSGDVVGPTGPITDNAIVRFDGTTGKLVQNSGVEVDDSGNIKMSYSSGALGRINYQAASGDKVFLLQTITSVNNYGIGVDSSNLVTLGSVSGADTWNVKAIQYASSGAVTLGPSTLAKHTVNGRFKLSVYTESGAGPFNNYALGNYGVVAFTNGGAVILTGITGGADGDVIHILCGAGTLRLDHNSGSSSAGNKLFNKTGANITLAANGGVTAVYTSGGWFIIYGP